jgi:hypothetical protein
MENSEPNKVISRLYKRLQKLSVDSNGMAEKYDYKEENKIGIELNKIHSVVGAVAVMSKNSLLKMVVMNAKLKSIPLHHFHWPFADALNK